MKRGQAMVEYSLIILFVAFVMIGVMFSLAATERHLFQNISDSMVITLDASGNPVSSTPTPVPTPTCDPNLPKGHDDKGTGKGQCK